MNRSCRSPVCGGKGSRDRDFSQLTESGELLVQVASESFFSVPYSEGGVWRLVSVRCSPLC